MPPTSDIYAALVQSIDQGFTVIKVFFDDNGTAIDYRFEETNPAFEQQTGIRDAVGKRMKEVAPGHENYWFEFYGQVARTGIPERRISLANELDGRWFDVYAFPIGAAEDHNVALLFKDITAEKRAEERLQRSEARHKFLLFLGDRLHKTSEAHAVSETAVETLAHYLDFPAVGYFELPAGQHAHASTEWRSNPATARHLHGLENFDPDDARVLESGKDVFIEGFAADGAALMALPILRDNHLVAVLYCLADAAKSWQADEIDLIREVGERTWEASSRAYAEQALRDSEAKLARLVELSPVGIGIVGADGQFLLSNPVMQRYAAEGLPSSIPAYRVQWKAFWPDGQPVPFDQWPGARALRGEAVQQMEFQYTGETEQWMMVSAVPLELSDTAGAKALIVIENITERKRSEQEIIAASQLKDEFLGLVSHELRTPLTIIRGNAYLLNHRVLEDDIRVEVLRDLVGSTERLTRIVENMLVLGRVGVGQIPALEPITLGRLLPRCVQRFQDEHGREVQLEMLDGPTIVLGVEEYLQQVLDNLLVNAHKYSPNTHPIEVSVGSREGVVCIQVLDRGSGVKDPERLFTPFYREEETAPTAQGLGIGLTVCRRLVEAQGGTIWVEPRSGGGSIFSFSLRSAEDRAPAQSVPASV